MALPLAKLDLHVRWPVFAPFVALGAAAVLTNWVSPAAQSIFGNGWIIVTRNELFAWGFPRQFWSNFVIFALLFLPEWVVLAGITFSLGLTQFRRAHQFAWLLSVAVPFAKLLLAGLEPAVHTFPLAVTLRVYFLVPVCGTLLGIAWWWAGYLIRGRHGRAESGLCAACGYDLRGTTSTECPECGHAAGTPAI